MRFLIAAIITMLSGTALAQSRHGEPIQPPYDNEIDRVYSVIEGTADARIVEDGVFELKFTTREATPPVRVYFGLNDITEELDFPRFRSSTTEEGDFPDLRTDHTIRVDFSRLVSRMPNTRFEPRITWRAEIYLPSRKSSRFIEGRVYFNPQTLGDTPNVLIGPFVEMVTDSSAVIAFTADRDAPASVRVGETVFTSESGALVHEIPVSGLRPDTRYEYQVSLGETIMKPYGFRTDGGRGPVRFAAMVDSREGVGGGAKEFYGVNAYSLFALVSDAYYRGVDFIAFPGDLINGYTSSVQDFRNQMNSFKQITAPVHARVPIYEGMGNHEALIHMWADPEGNPLFDAARGGEESAEWQFAEAFTNPLNGPADEGPHTPTYRESVYWFDRGNVRFFMINNNYWRNRRVHEYGGNLEGFFMKNQMDWIRREVARADADTSIQHLFFAAQEPPFPNGGHTGDAMWYRGGDSNKDGTIDSKDILIVENRNEMWDIISASPKTVAFITGDEHAYSRLIISDETEVGHHRLADGSTADWKHPVWQITSGGAGAPWYDKELDLPWSLQLKAHSTLPHYAYFIVDGDEVRLEAYALTGERIDEAILRTGGVNTTR